MSTTNTGQSRSRRRQRQNTVIFDAGGDYDHNDDDNNSTSMYSLSTIGSRSSAAMSTQATIAADTLAMRQGFGMDAAVFGAASAMLQGDKTHASSGNTSMYSQYYTKKKKKNRSKISSTTDPQSIGTSTVERTIDRSSESTATATTTSRSGRSSDTTTTTPRTSLPSHHPRSSFSASAVDPTSTHRPSTGSQPIPSLNAQQGTRSMSSAFPASVPKSTTMVSDGQSTAMNNSNGKTSDKKKVVDVDAARERLKKIRHDQQQARTMQGRMSTRMKVAAMILMDEYENDFGVDGYDDYGHDEPHNNTDMLGYLDDVDYMDNDDDHSHLPTEVRVAMMAKRQSQHDRRQNQHQRGSSSNASIASGNSRQSRNSHHGSTNKQKLGTLFLDKIGIADTYRNNKGGVWDRKKHDAKLTQEKNMVNLQAGSSFANDDDDYDDTSVNDMYNIDFHSEPHISNRSKTISKQDHDVFEDEIITTEEDEESGRKLSMFAKQLNKRKRIRIRKRFKHQTKPNNLFRRWCLIASLALIAIVLTIVVTVLVVSHSGSGQNGTVTDQSSTINDGPFGVDNSTNTTTTQEITNTTSDQYMGMNNITDEPVFTPAPNSSSVTILVPTSPPIHVMPSTTTPTLVPTSRPTPTSQNRPPNEFKCFEDHHELKEAIVTYMLDRSEMTGVAQKYGYPIGSWCTTPVTNFSNVFHYGSFATNVEAHEDMLSIRFSHFDEALDWDVSNGVDFSNMFRGAKKFRGEGLSDWDVSSGENMQSMFYQAQQFDQDLSRWNVGNVKNFAQMFEGAEAFNGNVATWQTGQATTMKKMFRGAYAFNGDLSRWNTSRLEDMSEMFARAVSFTGGDLRRWDLSGIKSLAGVFFEARSFTGWIGTWNVSGVTRMDQTFQGATSFNSAIHHWDMSSVTDMSYMFAFASSFDKPLEDWNTRSIRYMNAMFLNATSFDQPLGQWNVSGVISAYVMFLNATSFNQQLATWNLTSMEKMGGMFAGASSFEQDLCRWNTQLPGEGEDRASLLRSDSVESTGKTLFSDTSCPESQNPIFLFDPAGPFCFQCGQ